MQREYAFDVRITGVIRVYAESEAAARAAVAGVEAFDVNASLGGDADMRLTEISVDPDRVRLFETREAGEGD